MRWAILLLLALPAWADGFGPWVLGNDDGVYRPNVGAVASVTIAAMPFTRTVTCSTYTLTGTSTGSGAVSWSASPSGASGACTGTDTFSCVVDVDPDAVGEGVETITVTRGSATDTETLGFYVDGEHSCFLAQSVNGSYNVGLANLDAVATWENLGSSALDVTQGTGAAQPTYRTSIVGGQPVVRCDGGDRLFAAAPSTAWDFLSNATDTTVEAVIYRASDDATWQMYATTRAFTGTNAFYLASDNRTTSSGLMRAQAAGITAASANNTETAARFNLFHHIYDDTGGVDLTVFMNGTSIATASTGTGVPAVAPLYLCSGTDSLNGMTGDVFAVRIYQSALGSTQRGINKAVDEWALGGTLPVTP
jgi:hypothetical protein